MSELNNLVNFIQQHPRLFILTGAGCSTASGIPDYRAADGSWKHSQPIQYQDFVKDLYTRKRYWARSMLGWPRFSQAQPNAAHKALTQLEQAGYVQQLATQNVDGLHQTAGSRKVIDLHGRLDRVLCLDCGYRLMRQTVQQTLLSQNPSFSALPTTAGPDGDALIKQHADFNQLRLPQCPRCQGMLKPDVVFYGENVPRARVDLTMSQLSAADALLVVGSSLMVFSGYRYCRAAVAQNKPIAAINLGRTRADDEITLKVVAPCDILTELVERLSMVN